MQRGGGGQAQDVGSVQDRGVFHPSPVNCGSFFSDAVDVVANMRISSSICRFSFICLWKDSSLKEL